MNAHLDYRKNMGALASRGGAQLSQTSMPILFISRRALKL